MKLTERDYECVGRWLDGQELELTPAQRALAEEIVADAGVVGPALDVALPPGTLHRAQARMVGLGRFRRRRLPWVAAAAAAVAIAVGLWALIGANGSGTISPQQYVEAFLQDPGEGLDARVELLAEEMADYQVRLALGELWPLEMALQGLEEDVGEFDPRGRDPAEAGADDLWEELLW